ncbi:MAG TPA: CoA-binding protein [Anaeromyxobacteraceae bacterium]|nr:CoA-binding protein [Anaeromyxobacteraceae bacterium]
MDPINLERARKFLEEPRVALVGVSRDSRDFSRLVFRELAKRGIDVVPVNPAVAEVEGRACFPRLSDVKPPVQAALLMTHPAQTGRVLDDCVEAGVKRVWLHRGAGSGSGDARALAFCEQHGIEAVRDLCPFMALPNAGFAHALHGFFRKRLA